ncbi:hypothetical protein SEA_ESTES_105 [Mycobacterium phage Estes]|uniref:Uncharacterized protein n=1 Tax=Mycobacterium phage Estes TaxID=2759459 RepID=A0A7G9A2H3_9CAUD|nr:hypothetical protein J4U03_gp151 [Mycobacterium phage Estes]QNL30812.1 hypothetical protein SEA_ESTES_105 [Mycobacterium phage Estes]
MGMQDKVEEQSEAWQLRAVTMIHHAWTTVHNAFEVESK